MSRVLPNAMVAQAFRKLGIRSELLEADLPPMVDLGLQKLYGFQHNDGGWGWWYDDSTDVNQTAYVLLGLAMTEQAGFDVDDGVLDRGAEALRGLLLSERRSPRPGLRRLRAGHGRPAADDHAHAERRAGTGPVLPGGAGHRPRRHGRRERHAGVARQSARGGGPGGRERLLVAPGPTRPTAARSWAPTCGPRPWSPTRWPAWIPSSPLLPGAVRWLMAKRQGDGWGDTQKTSFAILALSDYLLATQELAAGSAFEVYVNGELWQAGALDGAEASRTLVLTYTAPVTGGAALSPTVAVTTGESLTATEVLTPSEGLTATEPITAGEAVTVSEAVSPTEALTPTAVTPTQVSPTVVVSPTEAVTALLRPGENQIRFVLSSPAGRLYYAATLKVQRRPREGAIPALAAHERSIVVQREYYLYGTRAPATQFGFGDLVEVRLTLDVPEEAWYVVVDDPLPAGFEALNERLGTTSHVAAAYWEEPVYYWEEYGYNRKDVRDERVSFFITHLAPGQRTLTYLVRATTTGSFTALPTQVYPMYEPEVWSRSESSQVQIGAR